MPTRAGARPVARSPDPVGRPPPYSGSSGSWSASGDCAKAPCSTCCPPRATDRPGCDSPPRRSRIAGVRAPGAGVRRCDRPTGADGRLARRPALRLLAENAVHLGAAHGAGALGGPAAVGQLDLLPVELPFLRGTSRSSPRTKPRRPSSLWSGPAGLWNRTEASATLRTARGWWCRGPDLPGPRPAGVGPSGRRPPAAEQLHRPRRRRERGGLKRKPWAVRQPSFEEDPTLVFGLDSLGHAFDPQVATPWR